VSASAATSPHHLLALQRTAGNRSVCALLATTGTLARRAPSGIVVQRDRVRTPAKDSLGTTSKGTEVRVVREVGAKRGYEGRWQAIVITRLAKVEPAAAVLRADGRWRAVETSAPFDPGPVTLSGAPADVKEVYGVPLAAGLDKARKDLASYTQQLAALDQIVPADAAMRKAIEEKRTTLLAAKARANRTRLALTLGVTESEVEITRSIGGNVVGKINVTATPDTRSPGGGHGPVAGQPDVDFSTTTASAIWIDLPEFDKRDARSQSVLFHETLHLKDFELAKLWVTRYETEGGRIFVKGAAGTKPFQEWLAAQVKKKRLTQGELELVVDETFDVSATTEARANIRTFLAHLQVGDPADAVKELESYAKALPPGTQYGTPPSNSNVLKELIAEVKEVVAGLPRNRKDQYRIAVDTAIRANPQAWIKVLKTWK
jgi:hypothetical protein